MRSLVSLIVILGLATTSPLSFAQDPNGETEMVTPGPRRQLSNIVFAGLAGAILGLSTLSFYGRPQDKLSNIAIGFAFGVIIGTAYSTYKAASEPKDFYGLREAESEGWAIADRTLIRDSEHQSTPRIGFSFEY